MAFKVEVTGPVRTIEKTIRTPLITVPGIGTGVAYASGDAMGTKFTIGVPKSGTIQTAIMLDKDREGIETDLVLFTADFVGTADNAVFDPTDLDLQEFLSTITFATFKSFNSNMVSTASALGIAYTSPIGQLWAQMVTRGAPNIAANNIPQVALTILSDE